MELTGLLPIIRRWLVVIIAATVMATLVGLILGSAAGKTYEAKAQMLVGPLNTDRNTMQASGDLAQTYAELATSGTVLSTVARDVDIPRGQLAAGVRATANSSTRFLVVRARSESAKGAAKIANGVALQLIELGRQDPSRPEGQLQVIDPATPPSQPVSPRLDLIVPLAAAAGLLGSLALILLFEFLGDTVETSDDIDAITEVPTLVVKRRRLRSSGPDPYLRRIEPYRIIATQADLSRPNVQCILLTEASSTDGSASLVLELAEVWGERHSPVVVVDAGVGEITAWASLEGEPGLAQVVTGAEAEVTLMPWVESIDVLGAGIGRRTEAIDVEGAQHLVEQLAGDNGLVVIHGLPPTSSAATLVWARVADVTILLVRRSQSRRTAIEEATVNLRTVGANLAFSVLHEGGKPLARRSGATPPSPGATPRPGSGPGADTRRVVSRSAAPIELPATSTGTAPNGGGTASARRTQPPRAKGTRSPAPAPAPNGSKSRTQAKALPGSSGRT